MSKAGVENIRKKLEENLEKSVALLAENRFAPTATYDIKRQYFLGVFTLKNIYIPNFIAYIDANSNRLAFAYLLKGNVDFLDFCKISSYKLITIGKTSGVSTGSMLGCDTGLGMGAGISSSSTEFVGEFTKIIIRVTLTDLNNSSYDISLHDEIYAVNSKSQYYTAIMDFVERFKPVLDNIIRVNQQKAEKQLSIDKDYVEELKKFKALLDGGIITQEEFDAKKKQLLGL